MYVHKVKANSHFADVYLEKLIAEIFFTDNSYFIFLLGCFIKCILQPYSL